MIRESVRLYRSPTCNSSPSTASTASTFPPPCAVLPRHIEAMHECYDKGFCDQRACNAVALALSEALGEKVLVIRHCGKVIAQTARKKSWELPESVGEWLVQADRGLPLRPFNLTGRGIRREVDADSVELVESLAA